ncbi:MAG: hypothetical protein K9J27_11755 [Bacteroidales bacterium]|nr:hypothetical protein [Bacteroidales bacterium]MCF8334648.1 hypothetical protein [Bacteroidales bacterium]
MGIKHKIKLPDAIIAATSLVYDLTLITRNSTDFKNIDELRLINPWDFEMPREALIMPSLRLFV